MQVASPPNSESRIKSNLAVIKPRVIVTIARRCWLLHQWTKWEQYVDSGTVTPVGWRAPVEVWGKPYHYQVVRQKRRCIRCGYLQDKDIYTR
jgi:hypothetical protein